MAVQLVIVPLSDYDDADGFFIRAVNDAVFPDRNPVVGRARERLGIMRAWVSQKIKNGIDFAVAPIPGVDENVVDL